jgi:hypothetical protein
MNWKKLDANNAAVVAATIKMDQACRAAETEQAAWRALRDGYGRGLRAAVSRKVHEALADLRLALVVQVSVTPMVNHLTGSCAALVRIRWGNAGGLFDLSTMVRGDRCVAGLLRRFKKTLAANKKP